MRDIPGTPGTFTGLFFRFTQLILAAASLFIMSSIHGFTNSSTSWFCLFEVMCSQTLWSAGFVCADALFLAFQNPAHSTNLISTILMTGDSVMAVSGLASASASFGVAMYLNDQGLCQLGVRQCVKVWIPIVLALLSCTMNFASFLVMLWAIA